MDKTARDVPKWTKAFWRRVVEIYERAGGRLMDDDTVPMEGTEE